HQVFARAADDLQKRVVGIGNVAAVVAERDAHRAGVDDAMEPYVAFAERALVIRQPSDFEVDAHAADDAIVRAAKGRDSNGVQPAAPLDPYARFMSVEGRQVALDYGVIFPPVEEDVLNRRAYQPGGRG